MLHNTIQKSQQTQLKHFPIAQNWLRLAIVIFLICANPSHKLLNFDIFPLKFVIGNNPKTNSLALASSTDSSLIIRTLLTDIVNINNEIYKLNFCL